MKKVTKNHERISWGTGALATGTINRLFLEIIMNMEPSNIPKLTALFTLNRLLIYPILVAHRRIICQVSRLSMIGWQGGYASDSVWRTESRNEVDLAIGRSERIIQRIWAALHIPIYNGFYESITCVLRQPVPKCYLNVHHLWKNHFFLRFLVILATCSSNS